MSRRRMKRDSRSRTPMLFVPTSIIQLIPTARFPVFANVGCDQADLVNFGQHRIGRVQCGGGKLRPPKTETLWSIMFHIAVGWSVLVAFVPTKPIFSAGQALAVTSGTERRTVLSHVDERSVPYQSTIRSICLTCDACGRSSIISDTKRQVCATASIVGCNIRTNVPALAFNFSTLPVAEVSW